MRASEKLREHVTGLTRHHLRLGFMVHKVPLARRELYRYLEAQLVVISAASTICCSLTTAWALYPCTYPPLVFM